MTRMERAVIPKQPGSQYSDQDRRRACLEYAILGNQARVAENTGIPKSTLQDWRQEDWWIELSVQIRSEKHDELDCTYTKLIDLAFEQAEDRMRNGDYRLFKDQLVRVPMSGRDLVIGGATVYDKQRLHRNQPTAITDKRDSLASMVKKFNELADAHIKREQSVVSDQ